MLGELGWKQEPTIIQEDNSACAQAAKTLPLAEHWFKEKVAEGACIIEKVGTAENNADIGTKRLALPLVNKLTYALVDKTKRTNL
jgi:ABC-type taurine transport system substrate-binding protein